MPEAFVCVRLEAISASAGRHQFLHDVRERVPAYLKRDPKVIFRDLRGLHRNRSSGRPADAEAIRALHWELEQRRKDQKEMYCQAHRKRLPRGTRPFVRVLVAFSRQVEEIPVCKLLCAAEEFFLSLAAQGNLPFVYFAFHEDEESPHFHALLENYDYELNETRYRALGRRFFSDAQDMAEEYFQHLGFRRGISRTLTGEIHRSPREARNEDALLKKAGQIMFRDFQRQFVRAGLAELLGQDAPKGSGGVRKEGDLGGKA